MSVRGYPRAPGDPPISTSALKQPVWCGRRTALETRLQADCPPALGSMWGTRMPPSQPAVDIQTRCCGSRSCLYFDRSSAPACVSSFALQFQALLGSCYTVLLICCHHLNLSSGSHPKQNCPFLEVDIMVVLSKGGFVCNDLPV